MTAHSPFSAALIAGGKSHRMGRDKCLLEIDGIPLWRRQLAVLVEMQPAEILISCRREQEYFQSAPATLIHDAWPDAGPLGGIASVLRAAREQWVLVLAVDMPKISASFLGRLFDEITPDSGAVIRTPDGYEPLAAIYPKALCRPACDAATAGKFRLQDFVQSGVEAGLMRAVEVAGEAAVALQNMNTPDDLPQS